MLKGFEPKDDEFVGARDAFTNRLGLVVGVAVGIIVITILAIVVMMRTGH